MNHGKLIVKATGFRVIAILFTMPFVGLTTSIFIHVGLFLLYYAYDYLWMRFQ